MEVELGGMKSRRRPPPAPVHGEKHPFRSFGFARVSLMRPLSEAP